MLSPIRGAVLPSLLVLAALHAAGCGVVDLFSDSCEWEASISADSGNSIARALRYLEGFQLLEDQFTPHHADYAGDWPQCFAFERQGPYIRDVNPFVAAFAHHALAHIHLGTQDALGLSQDDIGRAYEMRTRAIELMLRFAPEPTAPSAGTFGFWPTARQLWHPGDLWLEHVIADVWGGPRFMGSREPLNVSFFPPEFAIPTDADVTATIYSALLDHHLLDGGPQPADRIGRFFADWRDLGQVPQRHDQPWIPDSSGAFLTWLAYTGDPENPPPNDVDLLVNANVLFALGRYEALDTDGVEEATAIINAAVDSGAHILNPEQLSLYYPNNLALHYFVTRAFAEGGVVGLAPSVEILARDLAESVIVDGDLRYWDRGDPHLNTAFAVLSLVNAGVRSDLVDGGVRYLVSEQDANTGAWDAGVFFLGRLDGGAKPVWISAALTSAIAIEAIAKATLTR